MCVHSVHFPLLHCCIGLTYTNHCPLQRQWMPGTSWGESVCQAGISCFLWLSKHRGSALWLPWRDLLFPTSFVMASHFRHQLLCGRWEVLMLNWWKKRRLQRCRMWACKSNASYKSNTSGQLERKEGGKAGRGWRGEGHELRGRQKEGWGDGDTSWTNWRDERTK